jgi:hypothetical protein
MWRLRLLSAIHSDCSRVAEKLHLGMQGPTLPSGSADADAPRRLYGFLLSLSVS